jgi:serine/threonine-protein kinase HipA
MISEPVQEAFVWIWLPDATEPVVAGRLQSDGNRLMFNYGRSYLERIHATVPAIPIYEPELPLKPGFIAPLPGLSMAGSIRDAAPDAWGRRVIINKLLGLRREGIDTAQLDELTCLLESGSDRIGALDFQRSPTEYVPRTAQNVGMDELMESAERVEQGMPLTTELDQALFHGSSIGGARPKSAIEDNTKKYIAKFSSTTDLYDVVKAEYIAMRLAALAGLRVAPVILKSVAHKDVLLIERFDRSLTRHGWQRHAMVSALTILGLDAMMARYASYQTLAELIRRRFIQPRETLKELFGRLVFNVLCGNTDDHARNHAAFWDGQYLTLTPAYDICPQGRTGNEASQAMLIHGNHNLSQLKTCLQAAHHFLLSRAKARSICEHVMQVIETHWESVCDEAALSEMGRKLLWRRQFLNPFSKVME